MSSTAAETTTLEVAATTGQALTIKTPLVNNINEVLSFSSFDLIAPSQSQILVQFLASPISPIDIHVLANRYPVKPSQYLSSSPIPGFDGVARILSIGSAVTDLSPGHLVIPRVYGLGTWRTHALLEEKDVIRIRRGTNPIFASLLKTVILPAYFLVEDMKPLEKDDWIVMNAGTSAIAGMVAQFAKLKGAKTIIVIRDRGDSPTANEVKDAVSLVADVLVEESAFFPEEIAKDKKVVLALDSVWGESARKLATAMGRDAVFVTYGQFGSGGPDAVMELTFKDVFLKGGVFRSFRTTAQAVERSEEDIEDLLAWFIDLFDTRQLRLPRHRVVKWNAERPEEMIAAVGDVMQMEKGGCKTIFVFE